MKTIRGKLALITGAASGIGREMARQLALEGAHVYLLDVDDGRLSDVVRDARVCGVEVIGGHCDLTKPAEITASIAEVLSTWGSIDVLVNNAGVCYYGPTDKMTAAQWDWLLGVNLLAPIQITRELLPTLLSRSEAHVLNMCSVAGLVAGPRSSAYHVSKFGLVGFSEALRAEYSRQRLGVTAFCPGPVRTNLYRKAQTKRQNRPVPEPPAWLSASPERVALRAIRAIRRNERFVLMTPVAHLLFNTKRFAPWFLDGLARLGRRNKPSVPATNITLRPFNPESLPASSDDAARRAA
jgi:short-subunit dehydrogenase